MKLTNLGVLCVIILFLTGANAIRHFCWNGVDSVWGWVFASGFAIQLVLMYLIDRIIRKTKNI